MRKLHGAVADDSAMRRIQRLQPAFGVGEKVFPPTYAPRSKDEDAPPEHCFERRAIPEMGEVWCCIMDSIPSQANRHEHSLLSITRAGEIEIPYVYVDFAGFGVEPEVLTTLEVPHRIYDAFMRDSLLDGTKFLESELGLRIVAATPEDATPLLETSPNTLVFGGWHTQGVHGGSGAKFQRCMQSEIIAINVPVDVIEDGRPGRAPSIRTTTRRTSSRRDPAGIQKKVPIYPTDNKDWDTQKPDGKKSVKPIRPSEINHGSITPDFVSQGITMEYAEQRLGLSLAALRRLRFGSPEKSVAARLYLAATALLSVTVQDEGDQYSLRSGCDLTPAEPAPWELLHRDGKTEMFTLSRANAIELYRTTFQELRRVGFNIPSKPIRLSPRPQLVDLIRKSQDPLFDGEEPANKAKEGGEA